MPQKEEGVVGGRGKKRRERGREVEGEKEEGEGEGEERLQIYPEDLLGNCTDHFL